MSAGAADIVRRSAAEELYLVQTVVFLAGPTGGTADGPLERDLGRGSRYFHSSFALERDGVHHRQRTSLSGGGDLVPAGSITLHERAKRVALRTIWIAEQLARLAIDEM